jgi:hypothetical protein
LSGDQSGVSNQQRAESDTGTAALCFAAKIPLIQPVDTADFARIDQIVAKNVT